MLVLDEPSAPPVPARRLICITFGTWPRQAGGAYYPVMQLVGMLDSPYVRRVAVSLHVLGLPFEHRSLSVFSTYDAFAAISPVVKAPSLVCDDGTVLIDSTLILAYAQALPQARRALLPAEPQALAHALSAVGLALAACEKTAQIIYELGLRPPEKHYAPWLDRIRGQLRTACAELEQSLAAHPRDAGAGTIDAAGIAAAVAWYFVQQRVPQDVPAAGYPHLTALSAQAEATDAFRAAPYGELAVGAP